MQDWFGKIYKDLTFGELRFCYECRVLMKLSYPSAFSIMLCITLLTSGCTQGIYVSRLQVGPSVEALKDKHVVFSSDLRGVVVEPPSYAARLNEKGKGAALDLLKPVFNEKGAKMSLDEYEQSVTAKNATSKPSMPANMVGGVTGLLAVPFLVGGVVVFAVGFVLLLPYNIMVRGKANRGAFDAYERGLAALDKKDPALALASFNLAYAYQATLLQESDFCFKLAQAYELAGDKRRADEQYQHFLDYSVRLYPDYFESINKTYKNDFAQLRSEFENAEQKISVR